jgi:hypothetical protein
LVCNTGSNIFQFDFDQSAFSKLKSSIPNFEYFDYISGDFAVSDYSTLQYSTSKFTVPSIGKTLFDIKIGLNGNIYYFFKTIGGDGKVYVSYLIGSQEYQILDGANNVISFDTDDNFDGVLINRIIISVGNNIIIGQRNSSSNLVVYINTYKYFTKIDSETVSFFQDIIPLNIFQINPFEFYILYISSGNILLTNIDLSGQEVTNIFNIENPGFNAKSKSDLSVFNSTQRLILYDQVSGTNGLLYLENDQTTKTTYIPVNYTNALFKLNQDNLYMIADTICS